MAAMTAVPRSVASVCKTGFDLVPGCTGNGKNPQSCQIVSTAGAAKCVHTVAHKEGPAGASQPVTRRLLTPSLPRNGGIAFPFMSRFQSPAISGEKAETTAVRVVRSSTG